MSNSTYREVRQALFAVRDQDRPASLDVVVSLVERQPTRDSLRARLLDWASASKFLRLTRVTEDHAGVSVILRSARNDYIIYANADGVSDHLGAYATDQASGKGNDLSDGRVNLVTWCAILADIVGIETGVHLQDTCPICGEPDKDNLVIDPDTDQVRCSTCGATFQALS